MTNIRCSVFHSWAILVAGVASGVAGKGSKRGPRAQFARSHGRGSYDECRRLSKSTPQSYRKRRGLGVLLSEQGAWMPCWGHFSWNLRIYCQVSDMVSYLTDDFRAFKTRKPEWNHLIRTNRHFIPNLGPVAYIQTDRYTLLYSLLVSGRVVFEKPLAADGGKQEL